VTHAERVLYQQIHPLKLLTDVTTSFASCWMLWQADWARAAGVAFVPSGVVTVLLLWRADLDAYKATPMGRYVARFMTSKATALRVTGQALMWAGAAAHMPWVIPLGFLIIVFGWMSGLWLPSRD
jgi:hypothetical protein